MLASMLFNGRYDDVIVDDGGTPEAVTADGIDDGMTDDVEATATLSHAVGLALAVSRATLSFCNCTVTPVAADVEWGISGCDGCWLN